MVLKEIQNSKIKIQNGGFTLVEVLVAMAVFSIVVGVAIGIFTMAMKTQRRILAQQQLLDQTSYAIEYMSRALRMAKKDLSGTCLGASNLNYLKTHIDAGGAHGIKFKNYQGHCQEFYLDGNELKANESALEGYSGLDLTASSSFSVINFEVLDSGWDQSDDLQPAVTFILDIQGREGTSIKIQTTVSQRNLDVKY